MNHHIMMNEETIDAAESDMRTRNDRHTSLTEFDGATAFKKQPLKYVRWA